MMSVMIGNCSILLVIFKWILFTYSFIFIFKTCLKTEARHHARNMKAFENDIESHSMGVNQKFKTSETGKGLMKPSRHSTHLSQLNAPVITDHKVRNKSLAPKISFMRSETTTTTTTASSEFFDNINSCNNDNDTSGDSQEKLSTIQSSLYSYISEMKCDSNDHYQENNTITLGLFSPYNQNQMTLGAMRLAIEHINNNPQMLMGWKLNYLTVDIGGSDLTKGFKSLPIRIMTEMRDNGTIAFIGGPEDSCESEALVAAAWNLPIISFKCADPGVSDKAKYYTFARTMPPSSKISKSLVALLKKFDWNKLVLVVSFTKPHRILIDAFKELAKNQNINITDTYSLADYIPANYEEMEAIVDKSYERTRVYVFIGEHVALLALIRALYEKNLFNNGEYIVITVDDNLDLTDFFDIDYLVVNSFFHNGDETILKAYRSVLKLTHSLPQTHNFSAIGQKFADYSMEEPFCTPSHPTIAPKVPVEAAQLYDAVIIYATALQELLQSGIDPRNGTAIFERIRHRSYHSIQGYDVFIDSSGDAEGNYTVAWLDTERSNDMSFSNKSMSMTPVGYFQLDADEGKDALPMFKYYDVHREIKWVGKTVPVAEPKCGFNNEKCGGKQNWKSIIIGSVFVIISSFAAIVIARYYRTQKKLSYLLWKIDMRDVIVIPLEPSEPLNDTERSATLCPSQLVATAVDGYAPLEFTFKKAYTQIGSYRGIIVAIKTIYKRNVELSMSILKELKQVREFRHDNIIPFIGASIENDGACILTAYSARGSLEDVLQNEDLHLDNMFLASLVADLIKGMIYLHDSDIICHGNLKSSNCLVDSRWVLQITDFGLHELKANQDPLDVNKERRKLLWRAPELLRDPNAPTRGTQKGDVYSFGIVLFEMVGRAGPWGKTELSVEEIIRRVCEPEVNVDGKYWRPNTSYLDCGEAILKCLDACWEENPGARPDFRYIRISLKEMQAGLKTNIFDNMLSIMEKYACNLENLVQERTTQLIEEKKKTEGLLHRMLPKSVAESLKRGERVEAESFDSVSIYFSDIVGFTALSAVSTPMQVVELLNDLYTCFDSVISHYDVYKVETIGDAYMVVSGLPLRNGNRHAGEIASMALRLLDRIKNFEIHHMPRERLNLRIGIHSGPVVSGVVGLKMPRYCLFGDTVNTASRMESTGEALKIHISDVTKGLLDLLGGYCYEERGIVSIKGKGTMCTYWLIGESPTKTNRISHAEVASDLTSNSSLL